MICIIKIHRVLAVRTGAGNGIFFEFSLCLSRACLGKMIVFIYKWLKNAVFRSDTKYTSWDVGGPRPVAGVQIWAKPLGGGKTAALFINGGATNTSANITLAELNITASTATVTDVWTGEVLAQNSSCLHILVMISSQRCSPIYHDKLRIELQQMQISLGFLHQQDAGAVAGGAWHTGIVPVLDSKFVIFAS